MLSEQEVWGFGHAGHLGTCEVLLTWDALARLAPRRGPWVQGHGTPATWREAMLLNACLFLEMSCVFMKFDVWTAVDLLSLFCTLVHFIECLHCILWWTSTDRTRSWEGVL